MAIVETRAVTGGVDTHLDVHVAAALDGIGGLLGAESFATTAAGYGELTDWLCSFGSVVRVGIEGTGSYGAGRARYLHTAGFGWWKSAALIVRLAVGRASPIPSTPSARPARGVRSGVGRVEGTRRDGGSDPHAHGRPPLRVSGSHGHHQPDARPGRYWS